MTEGFQCRTLSRLTVIPALLVSLLILVTVVPVRAQVDTGDQSSERPEGTLAAYMSFYSPGRADWAVVTVGTTGTPITWKTKKNYVGPDISNTFPFGIVGDSIMPGSFTGDATYDPAIWRTGNVWIDPFDNGPGTPYTVIPFGSVGDNTGRNGDYDGDGIDDVAIIRIVSSQLFWWIRPSSAPSTTRVIPFGNLVAGQSTFAFEGADFTGDGRDEIVVAKVVTLTGVGTWFVGDSVTGVQVLQTNWGNFNTDYFINPADYTGDGRADIPVWRAGAPFADPNHARWFILNPFNNTVNAPVWFGIGDPNFTNNDIPIRGDYDGDGIHDIAVYRPSTNTFWVRRSTDATLIIQQWGATGDIPLANFFTF